MTATPSSRRSRLCRWRSSSATWPPVISACAWACPRGKVFKTPILEYSYKNDDLHDPFINHYYALALELATQEELDTIAKYAFKVNEVLKKIMLDANIRLVDFKLEFGRLPDGTIILADEISPDTCRFWDATTGAHLDKDLFRRNMGGEADAYQEVMKRLLG